MTLDAEPLDLLYAASTPKLRSLLMEGLSEQIMRKICFDIFQKFRCKVRILSCVNGVVHHDAALSGLPEVMIAGVTDFRPLPGRVIISVEGDLIGALVDEINGSTSSEILVRTELSNMEIRYGKRLIDMTIGAMSDVLKNFSPVSGSVLEYETTGGMLSIAEGQSWMVSSTGILETELGFGSITIIGSYAGFEPLETRMRSRSGLVHDDKEDAEWGSTLERLTDPTPIPIRAEIARAQLPLQVVESLEPGQVLPIAILPHAIVLAGNIDIFHAAYGQSAGSTCLRIKALPPHGGLSGGEGAALPLSEDQDSALKPLSPRLPALNAPSDKRLFGQVNIDISVELGGTKISLRDLQQLREGQMIVLDQMVDAPLRIYANGERIASGSVVTIGETQYGIRVTELVERPDRA
jgi:flagellar motor switch protein FliM